MTFNLMTAMQLLIDTPRESPRSSDLGRSRAGAEAATRALLLRAMRAWRGHPSSTLGTFLLRRAATAVMDLPDPRERAAASRALRALDDSESPSALAEGLMGWAGQLEARGLLETADAILEMAVEVAPTDPELTLHAARIARKRGRLGDARILYDRVAELEGEGGELSLMASVGRALTSEDRVDALGAVLRRAVRAGAREAAAVAQEERARARRAASDVPGALRDYVAAAARYTDPIDRGRVGHEVADLFGLAGDLDGARHALLETARVAHPEQVACARARLQGIARAQGDQLGVRRYEGHAPPPLVSLSPAAGRGSTSRRPTGSGSDRTRRVVRRGLARIAERHARG